MGQDESQDESERESESEKVSESEWAGQDESGVRGQRWAAGRCGGVNTHWRVGEELQELIARLQGLCLFRV